MRRKKKLKACHFATRPSLGHHQHNTVILPIEIVKLEDNSFHPIIQVEINGIKGDIIIDTGASVTVVDQNLFPASPEDENIIKMQSGSVTGQIENVRLFRVKQFKIGNRNLKGIPLAAIDLQYVNDMYHHHLNRKIIGLLGCDFCVKYKAIINYRTKELTLNFLR